MTEPKTHEEIRILGPMAKKGITVGDVVRVALRKGVIGDRFWRRRLKDAETDQCCAIVGSEEDPGPDFLANRENGSDAIPEKPERPPELEERTGE